MRRRAYCVGCWVSGLLALLVTMGCTNHVRNAEVTAPYLYPHSSASSLTQTSDEHQELVRSVARRDAEALIDDLDLLFMTDRPTRLTRWHDQ